MTRSQLACCSESAWASTASFSLAAGPASVCAAGRASRASHPERHGWQSGDAGKAPHQRSAKCPRRTTSHRNLDLQLQHVGQLAIGETARSPTARCPARPAAHLPGLLVAGQGETHHATVVRRHRAPPAGFRARSGSPEVAFASSRHGDSAAMASPFSKAAQP